MKNLFLCLVSLSLLFTSCKKSKDAPAATKENIAGTYKITAHVFKMTGEPDEDIYAEYEECSKDDLYKFLIGGTLELREGAVSCASPNEADLTWNVSANVLLIDTDEYAIETFDGTNLKIKVYESSVGGVTEVEYVTFTKQ